MHVHVIDHNSLHIQRIQLLVAETLPGSTLTISKTHDKHTPYIDNADLIIISGGTWLVHKNPGTHRRLVEALLKTEKPIFAICLGAEAMANYFGVKLKEVHPRAQGIIDISITSQALVDMLGGRSAPVYEYHKWVVRNLPADFELMAESENGCEYFKHKKYPVWCTQFHPEVRHEDNKGYKFFEHALIDMGLLLRTK
jgi:GMP synthase (glutamine-hydrolysing)